MNLNNKARKDVPSLIAAANAAYIERQVKIQAFRARVAANPNHPMNALTRAVNAAIARGEPVFTEKKA